MAERHIITREGLASGKTSDMIREAEARGLVTLLSDEEREASRKEALARVPEGMDAWVFGYGSLMWNPAFEFEERRPALLKGWHRRFCLHSLFGRGTPDNPGLMLGLETGGSCRGVAFRIRHDKIASETAIVWRREMLAGAYMPRWFRVETAEGPVEAVTFVINRAYERYAGKLPEDEVARRIAQAEGPMGPCAEYLANTVRHLDEIGHSKGPMHELYEEVTRLRREIAAARGEG